MMTENTVNTIWKTYGKYIVLGIICIVLGYGGFQWKAQKNNAQGERSSLMYDKMIGYLHQKETAKTEEQGKQLIASYRDTPYAALAALLLARLQIEQNNPDKAIEYLQLAAELGEKGPVEPIARVRLARILASKQQFEEALKILDAKMSPGYTPLFEDVRGDIYVMQNDLNKARGAYATAATALKAMPLNFPVPLLQLKQNDLTIYKEES